MHICSTRGRWVNALVSLTPNHLQVRQLTPEQFWLWGFTYIHLPQIMHSPILYSYNFIFAILHVLTMKSPLQQSISLPQQFHIYNLAPAVFETTHHDGDHNPTVSTISVISSDWHSTAGSHGYTGLILGLHPANERRCYKVTSSLIGWAQT